MRKENERAAKKKARFDNFSISVQAFTASFTAFLLFYPKFLTCLSLFPTYSETSTALSYRFVLALVSRSPAILSSFLVLNLTPPHFVFTVLKTF